MKKIITIILVMVFTGFLFYAGVKAPTKTTNLRLEIALASLQTETQTVTENANNVDVLDAMENIEDKMQNVTTVSADVKKTRLPLQLQHIFLITEEASLDSKFISDPPLNLALRQDPIDLPLPPDLVVTLDLTTKSDLDDRLMAYQKPWAVLRPEGETEEESEIEEDETEETVPKEYTKLIFVGDSRFVGMSSTINHPICEWICDVSVGYDWFVNQAAPVIDASIIEDSVIVINLGVNDVFRPGDYVHFINSKAQQWIDQGAEIYFMSVNPVVDGYGGGASNAAIANFNQVMLDNMLPEIGYLDTYQYLMENAYGTMDGLHYDGPTYVAIFNYCLLELNIIE